MVLFTSWQIGIPWVSLEMAAVIGALVCVLTGCLTEKQAYASIDWVTIFLFAGMMPVSNAMDKTGAGFDRRVGSRPDGRSSVPDQ